jgi:hypothetical protein
MSSVASSIFRRIWKSRHTLAWKPLQFPTGQILPLPAEEKIEEETIPDFKPSRYYPVRIGDIFQERYQVIGKLGFGVSSTVWLARDLRWMLHLCA